MLYQKLQEDIGGRRQKVTPMEDSENTDLDPLSPRKSLDLYVKETKQRKADSNTRVDNNFIWAVL